jgi:His/Glu/Gln/Arg/opine family amino acid ABC transporter permease subunit
LPYRFDFSAVIDRADLFVQGVGMTIYVSVVSMALAIVLGLVIALLRMAKPVPLRTLGRTYVRIFRGVPLYVYIIWVYYGLAMLVGIRFQPVQAGVICLSTLYGAYLAEIDRGALQSIPREQRQAAQSLGLTPVQTFWDVILPQAVRTIIPPTMNLFAVMLMDSSLVSVIGVLELMRLTKVGASETFRAFEFYTTAAVIYVMLVLIFTRLSRYMERRYAF